MKSKIILSLVTVFLSATTFADLTNCTNANQSLTYSHTKEIDGQGKEFSTLTFKGISVVNQNSGSPLEFKLSEKQEILHQVSDLDTVTTSVAYATGYVSSKNQNVPFSEWVICREEVTPVCICP